MDWSHHDWNFRVNISVAWTLNRHLYDLGKEISTNLLTRLAMQMSQHMLYSRMSVGSWWLVKLEVRVYVNDVYKEIINTVLRTGPLGPPCSKCQVRPLHWLHTRGACAKCQPHFPRLVSSVHDLAREDEVLSPFLDKSHPPSPTPALLPSATAIAMDFRSPWWWRGVERMILGGV